MDDEQQAWREAFARQAWADFCAFQDLSTSANLPACQRLHFLQMKCEKLAKAYLISRGTTPETVQHSHGFTRKNLPLIVKDRVGATGWTPSRIQAYLQGDCAILGNLR